MFTSRRTRLSRANRMTNADRLTRIRHRRRYRVIRLRRLSRPYRNRPTTFSLFRVHSPIIPPLSVKTFKPVCVRPSLSAVGFTLAVFSIVSVCTCACVVFGIKPTRFSRSRSKHPSSSSFSVLLLENSPVQSPGGRAFSLSLALSPVFFFRTTDYSSIGT